MGEIPVFPVGPAPFVGTCRRVEAGACFDWLRQGWAGFASAPAFWLAVAFLSLVVLLALWIVPGVGSMVAALLFPIFMAGLLRVCRAQQDDEAPQLRDLLAGFRRNSHALLIIGLAAMLAFMLLGWLADWLARAGVVGQAGVGTIIGSWVRGMIVVLPLSLPILMALWFAPALAYFNDMPAAAAMRASFAACAANWLAFVVYGLILMVLLFFAALPVFLGFLLLLPVGAGTLHASYRDIFPAS